MTLWQIIISLNDGYVFVYDKNLNPLNTFIVGNVADFEDLDGIGGRIVKKYESTNKGVYSVILSDEVDENEKGRLPVYE